MTHVKIPKEEFTAVIHDSRSDPQELSSFYAFSFSGTVSDIRAASGLSRAAFCREYGIPIRTMENWEAGTASPPDYLIKLLAYAVLR